MNCNSRVCFAWALALCEMLLLPLAQGNDAEKIASNAKAVLNRTSVQAFENADLDPGRYGVETPNVQSLIEIEQLANKEDPADYYRRLKEFNDYPQPNQTDHWVRYYHHNPELGTLPYYVYIPPKYDHRKPTGMIVYLNGGINNNKNLAIDESKPYVMDNPYLEIGKNENLLILYTTVAKRMKWWNSFELRSVHNQLASVKKIFNVDDSRVWLSGHSDGATSALAMSATSPAPFAAFYPLTGVPNSNRKGNVKYRPIFFNEANASPVSEKAAINNTSMIPQFLDCKRPLLTSEITWEAIQGLVSGCDWLRVEKVSPSSENEFGRIKASHTGNTIQVETSGIHEFSVRLSPEMIDFDQPVKVFLNGKVVRDEIVSMEPEVMLDLFQRESDRQQVWCNVLRILVPGA